VLGAGFTPVKTGNISLDALNEMQSRNVKTERVTYKGREALRVSDEAQAGARDGDISNRGKARARLLYGLDRERSRTLRICEYQNKHHAPTELERIAFAMYGAHSRAPYIANAIRSKSGA
jgi:hypothetical protein